MSITLYLIEEESSARGSGEACWNQLRPVGQDGVTVGAGEEACSANVVQEDASHRSNLLERLGLKSETKSGQTVYG